MISRSNCAKTASIPAIARPVGVVRSSASVSDTKPTPQLRQFLQRRNQIGHRSAPPVQPPHQHHIDITPTSDFHYGRAEWPRRRTGTHLFHLRDHQPSAPGCILSQHADLHGQRLLIERGDAGVDPHPQHFRWFACLAKNLLRFRLRDLRFGGHFRSVTGAGRNLWFSATTPPLALLISVIRCARVGQAGCANADEQGLENKRRVDLVCGLPLGSS